jgi:hypothetical protein
MTATPISTGYVREGVLIHDNLCKKQLDILLRNHLKHKKRLTETQITKLN